MISYQFHLHDYRRFLEDFAAMLKVRVTEDYVRLPPNEGEGFIQLLDIQDGMEAIVTRFRLKKDLLIERMKSTGFEYYTLICTEITDNKEFSIQIDEDKTEITDSRRWQIYLTSFLHDISYSLKKDANVRTIRILLSPAWMQRYLRLDEQRDVLSKYLQLKTEGIWFKKVDTSIKEILNETFQPGFEDPNLLFYQNRCFDLVEKFFHGLHEEIQLIPKVKGISRKDIEAMIRIEGVITEDFSKHPPIIPELARVAAMSESKLKNLFKAVYGMPLYEYFQKNRMDKARHLLLSGNYSIKDIGHAVGYINLSNFTLAFKKEFNQLPSDILRDKAEPDTVDK